MLEVTGVSKYYGALAAVRDVSFTARPGEVLGYLGPNGSGKSTTVNMVAGSSNRRTARSASTARTSGTTSSVTGGASGTCRKRPTSTRT